MKEVILTQEGLEELKQRLDYLIVYLREDVAKKLQHARELGDLSENAEYDIAKDEQAKMEAEILEIEAKLRNVQIIDEKVKGDHADVGSKIEIWSLEKWNENNSKVDINKISQGMVNLGLTI